MAFKLIFPWIILHYKLDKHSRYILSESSSYVSKPKIQLWFYTHIFYVQNRPKTSHFYYLLIDFTTLPSPTESVYFYITSLPFLWDFLSS